MLVNDFKLGYALSNVEEILKIKQKTFVLLLIKQRFILEHPVLYVHSRTVTSLLLKILNA